MPEQVEPKKAISERRRVAGWQGVGSSVPDARSATVRARLAAQVARLNPDVEEEAMDWIEAISEFDTPDPT